jgi:hypothetical protein
MEEQTKTSSGGVAIALATLVFLLLAAPLLYVASVGPAILLAENGIISDEENSPATMFYLPIAIASENCEPFSKALNWYVEFWESP